MRDLALSVLFLTALTATAGAQQPDPAPPPAVPVGTAPDAAHCELTRAGVCEAGGSCRSSDVFGPTKLPVRLTVDFERRVLIGPDSEGWPVASSIGALALDGGLIVAQGVEGGHGWTLQLSPPEHALAMTVAHKGTVLTAFGSCVGAEDDLASR